MPAISPPGANGRVGLELIFVLDDQHVGIVDRAGLDPDQQLAGARHRIVDLGELQRLGPARRGGKQRLQCAASGKAGNLATSAGSCWMMTRAWRLRAEPVEPVHRGERFGAVGVERRHPAMRDLLGEMIGVAGEQHRARGEPDEQAVMAGRVAGQVQHDDAAVAEDVEIALHLGDLAAAGQPVGEIGLRLGRAAAQHGEIARAHQQPRVGKVARLAGMIAMIMADADDRDLLGPDADPGELVDDPAVQGDASSPD